MRSSKTIVVVALMMAVATVSFAWAANDATAPAERGAKQMRRGGAGGGGGMFDGVDREALKKMTPEERREFMRKRFENMTPEQREEMRERRGQGRGGRGAWFVERWLRDNDEFKNAKEAHHEAMKKIGEDLRALHKATREKLQDKDLTPEQKKQVIEDAKAPARALMGRLFDGRIRFQKFVTGLIEEHKEEILDAASEKVFSRRGNKRRGRNGADQGQGQGGPPQEMGR